MLAVSMLQRARQNYADAQLRQARQSYATAQLRQANAELNFAVPTLGTTLPLQGTALLRQCFACRIHANASPASALPMRR